MLLTGANAFFVAAEFSLVTVDRAAIDQLAQAGDRKARTVRQALRELSFQLSGAQLGITLAALLTGYLAEPALSRLLHPLFGDHRALTYAGALGIATVVSMLFGELVPKNAALARPMPLARATARPQRAFSTVLGWLIKALNGSANFVVRRFGVQPQEELASARSPEELGLLAAISARAGALPEDTARLLQRTIRFGDKRAAEAMTPRVDVAALPAGTTVAELLISARDTGHSRFPVYETLVGEIADEFDLAPAAFEITAPGADRSVLVEGVLREDELAEATGFRLPEGPYETLAGFLMARLGHIPLVGETVQEHGWEFTVVEVDRRRVEQVRVTMPEPADD